MKTLFLSLVLAQPTTDPAGSAVTTSRSWTMEVLVGVVFVGLAMYAVCRRSNRG